MVVYMLSSTLTSKGQATIPAEVRHALNLKSGDRLTFKIDDHKAVITKIEALDYLYYAAISNIANEEWGSPEDDEAYHDL